MNKKQCDILNRLLDVFEERIDHVKKRLSLYKDDKSFGFSKCESSIYTTKILLSHLQEVMEKINTTTLVGGVSEVADQLTDQWYAHIDKIKISAPIKSGDDLLILKEKIKEYKGDIKALDFSGTIADRGYDVNVSIIQYILEIVKATKGGVDELDLGDCNLSGFGIDGVAYHSKGAQIKKLNLSNNGFGSGGGEIIGEYLATIIKNTGVIELILNRCKLEDDSIKKIAKSLFGSMVKVLDISYNPYSEEGLMEIANGSGRLEKLFVSNFRVIPDNIRNKFKKKGVEVVFR